MPLISNLLTKVTADTSDFNAKMKAAEGQAGSFGKAASSGIGLLGKGLGLIGGAVAAFSLKNAVTEVGRLADDAKKLNISVGAFQNLAKAADDAGLSSQGLQNALAKMRVTLGDALGGNKAAIKSFQDLGLNINDLAKLSVDEQYLAIGEAISKIDDTSKQAAQAQNIFGRAAKDNLGFFNSNMREAVKRAQELGFAVSDTQAGSLDELVEKANEFTMILLGVGTKLIAELAPLGVFLLDVASKFLQAIQKGLAEIKRGIKEGGEALNNVFKKQVGGVEGFFEGLSEVFPILNNLRTSPKLASPTSQPAKVEISITTSPDLIAKIFTSDTFVRVVNNKVLEMFSAEAVVSGAVGAAR